MLTDEQYVNLLLSTVKKGSVLTLDGAGGIPFPSNARHHFIILNYNPQSNEFLVAVNHTSHVASRLSRLNRRGNVDVTATTVVIEPGTYSFFPAQTLFDCNSVHELTTADLLAAHRGGHLSVPRSEVCLSAQDLEKLTQAALSSKNVSPVQKRMIDPEFDV